MNSRAYYLNRLFLDPVHYPYGVEKSGDYSIAEVALLSSHGTLCQALMNDEVSDPSSSDRRLIKVARGQEEPKTRLERVWLKYWHKTHNVVCIPSMIMASGKSAVDSMNDSGRALMTGTEALC